MNMQTYFFSVALTWASSIHVLLETGLARGGLWTTAADPVKWDTGLDLSHYFSVRHLGHVASASAVQPKATGVALQRLLATSNAPKTFWTVVLILQYFRIDDFAMLRQRLWWWAGVYIATVRMGGGGWIVQFDSNCVIVCELNTRMHWSRRLASLDYHGCYSIPTLA